LPMPLPRRQFRFVKFAAGDSVERLPVIAQAIPNHRFFRHPPGPFVIGRGIFSSPNKAAFLDEFPNYLLVVVQQVWIAQGELHKPIGLKHVPELGSGLADALSVCLRIRDVDLFQRFLDREFDERAKRPTLFFGGQIGEIPRSRFQPKRNGFRSDVARRSGSTPVVPRKCARFPWFHVELACPCKISKVLPLSATNHTAIARHPIHT